VSVCVIPNRLLGATLLPEGEVALWPPVAVTNAPTSMLREVMTPSNGATIR
jgi:hypothetical protein